MPAEEIRAAIIESLKGLDTSALKRAAHETGFGESTLWKYRAGKSKIPRGRLRPLARVLGLSSKDSRALGDAPR